MATLDTSPRITTITLTSATAGPFQLTFRIFSTSLIVTVNGVVRTDYTLSATFTDGYADNATITFTSSLSNGDVVVIKSDLVPERQNDWSEGQPGLVPAMNAEMGRLWSALADQRRGISELTLDVERGTWDPAIANFGSGGSRLGNLFRVNDLVMLHFDMTTMDKAAVSDGTDIRIGGLPYQAESGIFLDFFTAPILHDEFASLGVVVGQVRSSEIRLFKNGNLNTPVQGIDFPASPPTGLRLAGSVIYTRDNS